MGQASEVAPTRGGKSPAAGATTVPPAPAVTCGSRRLGLPWAGGPPLRSPDSADQDPGRGIPRDRSVVSIEVAPSGERPSIARMASMVSGTTIDSWWIAWKK